MADDALTTSLRIGLRLDAVQAALALSAALRVDAGAAEVARIAETLDAADRLITETGAQNLTPLVLVERAALSELRGDTRQHEVHLRRAHEALTKMGATGRARAIAAALNR